MQQTLQSCLSNFPLVKVSEPYKIRSTDVKKCAATVESLIHLFVVVLVLQD